jgi:hypothetical protein
VARTASPCPCVNKSSTDKASFQCSHTRANFDIYLPQPRNESDQYAPQTSEFRAYTIYLFSYLSSYNAAPTFHGPRCQYAEDDRRTQYHDCRPTGRYRGFATGGTERGTEMECHPGDQVSSILLNSPWDVLDANSMLPRLPLLATATRQPAFSTGT